jgi:hypothetical protein
MAHPIAPAETATSVYTVASVDTPAASDPPDRTPD